MNLEHIYLSLNSPYAGTAEVSHRTASVSPGQALLALLQPQQLLALSSYPQMCVESSRYLSTTVPVLSGVLETQGQTVTGTYTLPPEEHRPGPGG